MTATDADGAEFHLPIIFLLMKVPLCREQIKERVAQVSQGRPVWPEWPQLEGNPSQVFGARRRSVPSIVSLMDLALYRAC